jgi:hypothetical protein
VAGDFIGWHHKSLSNSVTLIIYSFLIDHSRNNDYFCSEIFGARFNSLPAVKVRDFPEKGTEPV